MFYRNTALGVIVLLSLTACTSKGQNEQEALIVQSLENMIYVPGGTFMMGDGAFTEDVNGLTTGQYIGPAGTEANRLMKSPLTHIIWVSSRSHLMSSMCTAGRRKRQSSMST